MCSLISRNEESKIIDDEKAFFEIERKISFVIATYSL